MLTNLWQFLSWYLLISLVGLAALPLTFRFFPRLSSRGYAFTRVLGLLLWGFLFWLLGSLGILQNNLGGQVIAFLLLTGISMWAGFNGGWQQLREWLKVNARNVLAMELLFFGLFLFWTLIRGMNPEVAYTEKPMELAFINSILKSPSFPPQDPWLSGYGISYYYFGYVLIAMLTRASGVASAIAFNLSSALWFALTALAAYGVVFDLLSAWQAHRGGAAGNQCFARAGAFLAPFFILVSSTLEGLLEVLHARGVFWKLDADGSLGSKFWSWLAIADLDQAPQLPFTWVPNRASGWLWWRGSRVLQDLTLGNQRIEVIDEFPFFSYLLSDLHPHVLGMPFVLLSVAIALNLFLGASDFLNKYKNIQSWMRTPWFWLTALVLGSLAFMNTWDFPIYVGLFCFAWAYVRYQQTGWRRAIAWEFLKNGVLLGVTGIALYLPFYVGFSSQAGGVLPSLEFMTRGIHFWVLFAVLLMPILAWLLFSWQQEKARHNLAAGLKFSGILLAALFTLMIVFGASLYALSTAGPAWAASGNAFIADLGRKILEGSSAFGGLHGNYAPRDVLVQNLLRRILAPGTWLTLGGMLVLVIGLLSGRKQPLQALVSGTETADQHQTADVRVFVLMLVLFGVALAGFPEFFYLRDQFGWRMNTIFKFYFQAWILWGLTAAFASAVLLKELKGIRAVLFRITWAVVILASLVYPAVMLADKTNGFSFRNWTLDGNAYLNSYYPDDAAAIAWLQNAPMGIITEAVGGSYSDFARVSTRTGLPTVLGWPGHESQWRGGGAEMGSRMADIQSLYETQSWTEARDLIDRYNIRYIYVGAFERSTYKVQTDKFDAMLNQVYSNQQVRIYEAVSQNLPYGNNE